MPTDWELLKQREQEQAFAKELVALAERTKKNPTDADRDIDWAYRHAGVPGITPKMAPSVPAWSWYLMSLSDRDGFMTIAQKREDDKTKRAGAVTERRMEDDKRQQFAMIARLGDRLKQDCFELVAELTERFPEDLLAAMSKSGWRVAPKSQEAPAPTITAGIARDFKKLDAKRKQLHYWHNRLTERERALRERDPTLTETLKPPDEDYGLEGFVLVPEPETAT